MIKSLILIGAIVCATSFAQANTDYTEYAHFRDDTKQAFDNGYNFFQGMNKPQRVVAPRGSNFNQLLGGWAARINENGDRPVFPPEYQARPLVNRPLVAKGDTKYNDMMETTVSMPGLLPKLKTSNIGPRTFSTINHMSRNFH